VLLLGIGNDLRGDDGAGPRVARALEGRVPWDVRAVHGLTPEMADDLVEVDLALFVDAHADVALAQPVWTHHRVEAAAPGTPLLGHTLDVPALLALTAQLHGRAPRAATLSLPARDFSLGETLSPEAEAGVTAAVAALRTLARG
jgi:hydrogenase maturation protease